MSIEKLLQEHIEALNANTAALEALVKQGGGGGKATKTEEAPSKTTKADKPAKGGKAAAATTQDEMTAALLKLRDDYGSEHAKKVMKKHGFAKMAEVTEDKYSAVYKDAVKAYEALENAGEGDGEDDDM